MPEQAFITSNQDHPLEREAVRLVEFYLKKVKFPFGRVSVEVLFAGRPGVHSESKLDAHLNEHGLPAGNVQIIYNLLYIQQHPGPYLTDIVPHELAHVLTSLRALRQGMEYREHGPEWQGHLAQLSSDATPSPKGPGPIWDDRALVLDRGGVPARCGCDGDEGFRVIATSGATYRKLSAGELDCSECGQTVRAVPFNQVPDKVQLELEYIQDEKCRRAQ